MIGRGWVVATGICPIQVCMRLNLNDTIGTWAEDRETKANVRLL